MTEIDIATLKQADTATLEKWWCELNRLGWPDALVEPEPVKYVRHSRRSELMDWIVAKIGIKECLRACPQTRSRVVWGAGQNGNKPT